MYFIYVFRLITNLLVVLHGNVFLIRMYIFYIALFLLINFFMKEYLNLICFSLKELILKHVPKLNFWLSPQTKIINRGKTLPRINIYLVSFQTKIIYGTEIKQNTPKPSRKKQFFVHLFYGTRAHKCIQGKRKYE